MLPSLAPTDRKIAIEVDGPFHFAVNTNSPLGQTMIRRRLLRACGWTVISVPCHTWWVGMRGRVVTRSSSAGQHLPGSSVGWQILLAARLVFPVIQPSRSAHLSCQVPAAH